jgi:hypothetical protein
VDEGVDEGNDARAGSDDGCSTTSLQFTTASAIDDANGIHGSAARMGDSCG